MDGLDDIFNIDFGQIFAPQELLSPPKSNYRGINLPKKKKGERSGLVCCNDQNCCLCFYYYRYICTVLLKPLPLLLSRLQMPLLFLLL